MPARFKDLVLDANDHQKLADWWCAAMGYRRRDELEPPEDGWVRPQEWPVPIVDPAGQGPLFWIVPVPEGSWGEYVTKLERPQVTMSQVRGRFQPAQ